MATSMAAIVAAVLAYVLEKVPPEGMWIFTVLAAALGVAGLVFSYENLHGIYQECS